jgi:hypothetical protein
MWEKVIGKKSWQALSHVSAIMASHSMVGSCDRRSHGSGIILGDDREMVHSTSYASMLLVQVFFPRSTGAGYIEREPSQRHCGVNPENCRSKAAARRYFSGTLRNPDNAWRESWQ